MTRRMLNRGEGRKIVWGANKGFIKMKRNMLGYASENKFVSDWEKSVSGWRKFVSDLYNFVSFWNKFVSDWIIKIIYGEQ